MIDAAVLRAMAAAGATTEVIIAAVEAAQAADEARKAAKRAGNAKRQRRFKEKRRVEADNAGNALPGVTPLDKERSPTPPKEIKPLSPVIPDGMTPPPISPSENPAGPAEPANDTEAPITLDELVEDWNELARQCGLPTVAKLTDSRRRRAMARIRQYPEVEAWQRAFACIRGSPWMQGQNDRGWRADFDFLLQDKSFTKLVEGSYGQA